MGLLDDEEMLPFFGNPALARQGAKARAAAQGRGDVNMLPDPRTYAIISGLLGTAPDEMGFSVLNPDYEGIQRVARPAFAVGTALGMAPLVGAAGFTRPAARAVSAGSQRGSVNVGGSDPLGLPVGMSIKDVSYRGSHLAPNAANYGATIDDLGKIMPEDVYSSKGISLYGSGDRRVDSEWFAAAYKAKGNPDKMIEIFRAVPKGVKDINEGDFVTTSRTYAKNHGEAALGGDYDIVSMKVKANTLSSEGYPYEFGYNTNAANVSGGLLDDEERRRLSGLLGP